MENWRNFGTKYGEYGEFQELSREEMGIPKVVWKFKRSSPFEGDAPNIYRKWGVKRTLNKVK